MSSAALHLRRAQDVWHNVVFLHFCNSECVRVCASLSQHPLRWHTVSCQQSVWLMHIHQVHLCLLPSGYLSDCKKKKKKLQCNSLRVTCVHDGKRQEKCLGRDFWHLWHVTLSATELWNKLFAFASVCTLTVLLVRLLLCQFLLRCDFQHCQAPAGFQLLWFVADDGTILTQRFAASNHSNRKGGELSGSWAHSQVMSSHSL